MDSWCSGYLFHDPEGRCVRGPVLALRCPLMEVMLLEIGLGGWFLWRGKLPAIPVPSVNFRFWVFLLVSGKVVLVEFVVLPV